MEVPAGGWVFPYVEDPAGVRRGRVLLRPIVALRLIGNAEAPFKVAALVDSGSEHTLATPALARAIVVDPDPSTETTIGIGGKPRKIRFANVTLQLFRSIDQEEPALVAWNAEVGFFDTNRLGGCSLGRLGSSTASPSR